MNISYYIGIVSDPEEGILIESFEYRTPNGLHFTVLSDSQESTNELYELFEKASMTKPAKFKSQKPSSFESITKGFKAVSSKSWCMTNYVILSLEKLGDGIDSIPGKVIRKTSHNKDPSNLASGVANGTKSLLTKVFGAVAGVIVEPLKGAKKGGLKGGAVGFGKGMLGLVCKPVKGTIDLVT